MKFNTGITPPTLVLALSRNLGRRGWRLLYLGAMLRLNPRATPEEYIRSQLDSRWKYSYIMMNTMRQASRVQT